MSAARHTSNRELRKLIRQAEEHGWRVTQTKKCHLKFRSPEGQVVVTGGSPSDTRSVKNARAQLRRAGLQT